jgi:DNA-binding GntR family transcriptional regulator
MPASESAAETKRSARRDRVVRSVLLAIFSGEVVGGDRLVEEELALRLGVSRTPIREALRELASLGVIWLKPNHGAMVRPFGPAQLREIYQMRRILETEATRVACKSIPRDALEEIRDGMQELLGTREHSTEWSDRALLLDQQLHALIARSSGCERLAEEIHQYWKLAYTIGEAVRNTSQTQDHAIREHTAIIDALLARNPAQAADAMAQHIDLRFEAALLTLYPHVGRGGLLISPRKGEGFAVAPPPQARGPLLSNEDGL